MQNQLALNLETNENVLKRKIKKFNYTSLWDYKYTRRSYKFSKAKYKEKETERNSLSAGNTWSSILRG
jgi:hypothetical protein